MNLTQYIKESCEHQLATDPENFINMALAWNYASEMNEFITMDDLESLITLVHDKDIEFRSTPVVFANGGQGIHPQLIEHQLFKLLEHQTDISPTEFYYTFEEIHPWFDGNGRVGTLLFNALNGTIDNPIHPPHKEEWK